MQNTGNENAIVDTNAAVTTLCCALKLFFVRYLVINLDTVRGIPDDAAVINTAKTDSAT